MINGTEATVVRFPNIQIADWLVKLTIGDPTQSSLFDFSM
jgi:hypothetical protein